MMDFIHDNIAEITVAIILLVIVVLILFGIFLPGEVSVECSSGKGHFEARAITYLAGKIPVTRIATFFVCDLP